VTRENRTWRSSLLHALGTTDLTLDLLASPAGSLNGAGLEVSVLTSLLDHSGDPFSTVELGELAVRESIGEVAIEVRMMSRNNSSRILPNDSHGGTHERIASVSIECNDVEELEDRLNIWLK
jgi:hypothetical protein